MALVQADIPPYVIAIMDEGQDMAEQALYVMCNLADHGEAFVEYLLSHSLMPSMSGTEKPVVACFVDVRCASSYIRTRACRRAYHPVFEIVCALRWNAMPVIATYTSPITLCARRAAATFEGGAARHVPAVPAVH